MRRILLLLCTLTACERAEPASTESGARVRPPTPVEVVAATVDTVVDAVTATGAIEAVQSIELLPEVEGRLVEILAQEGSEVEAGERMFRLDDAELRAQVARLEADRDLAVQAVERARELIAQNAVSQADLDEAEANARSAQAQLDLQEVRLRRTIVRAPFTGVVGARLVSLGDYITTSTPLTTLQTADPQRAVFQVPERYAGRVGVGQRVSFEVAAVNKQFAGIVDFVAPVVELPARTITVKAVVRNQRRELRPGMFIEARLALEVKPRATVIPEDAILPVEGATYVWLVQNATVTRRQVFLGIRTPGFVEVTDGLEPGDEVVVGGLERLSEGAPVISTVVERR